MEREKNTIVRIVDAEFKKDSGRQPFSIYVSREVLKDFRNKCGDRSCSRVIEKFMTLYSRDNDDGPPEAA